MIGTLMSGAIFSSVNKESKLYIETVGFRLKIKSFPKLNPIPTNETAKRTVKILPTIVLKGLYSFPFLLAKAL